MCGLCGIAWTDPDRPVDPAVLGSMTSILTHRGPDSEGSFRAPGIGLGFRRLEIIDLETGDQPMASEDRSVVLVCNGEIYNFDALRKRLEAVGHSFRTRSDVEVLVHLYEDLGLEFVRPLRGMFAFALWDARHRRLVLGRDRLGIKPLFWAEIDGGIAFASEIKSILASGLVAREVDRRALGELFTLAFVRSPRTLLRTVRQVPPGELLVFEAGRAVPRRYWAVDFPEAGSWPRRSRGEWAEALSGALDESVALHLRSDVPLGAWLSGGLDSSIVVALAGRHRAEPLDAWSIAFEDPRFDEVSRARTLADYPEYRIRGHRVVSGARDLERLPAALWHIEDPGARGIEIPQMRVSEAASRSVRVVLTGEGADEILGGYPWYAMDAAVRWGLGRLPRRPARAVARRARRGVWRWLAPLLATAERKGEERFADLAGVRNRHRAAGLFADGAGPEPDAEAALPSGVDAERYASWHPFNRLQAWDLAVRLPDLILRRADRTSMAFGLEARVPFLDHEVVELCATMPPGVKWRGLREKCVLRDAAEPILPREIARRHKRPLQAPHDGWMRGPLPDFAEDLLSPSDLDRRGHFRPAAVRELLREHRQRRADHGDLLYAVLSVQLWDEIFVRGGGPPPRGGSASDAEARAPRRAPG